MRAACCLVLVIVVAASAFVAAQSAPTSSAPVPASAPPSTTANITPMNSPSAAPSGPCAAIRTRYECRELSDTQRQALFNAFNTLMTSGAYTKYVDWHVSVTNTAHGVPEFLPWHREYLRRLETELGVDLCYWDWASDAQVPEASPLLMPGWLGTDGSGTGGCISDAFWKGFTYQGQCVSCQWDGTAGGIGAFYAIDYIAKLITQNSQSYDSFRVAYEGTAHARIHNGIGAMFSQMTSPSNPLFFLHHSSVDRHWAIWQYANPSVKTNYPKSLSTNLPVFNIPVSQVMDTQGPGYCYTYSNMDIISTGRSKLGLLQRRALSSNTAAQLHAPAEMDRSQYLVTLQRRAGCGNVDPTSSYVAPPCDDDRTNLIDLRHVKPTPDWWLRMEGLNSSVIREVEAGHVNLINTLNRLPGYVSPSALINRPQLLKHVLKNAPQGTKFYLYKPGETQKYEINHCDTWRNNPAKGVQALREHVHNVYPVQDYEDMRPVLSQVVGPDVADSLILSGNKHANKPYATLPENEDRADVCIAGSERGHHHRRRHRHRQHHHHHRQQQRSRSYSSNAY